jgi:hypothetical protein
MSERRSKLARRAAEQAAAARRREQVRRRRRRSAGAAIAAALLVASGLVVVRLSVGGRSSPPQAAPTASTGVVAAVTSVPATVLNAVGKGTVDALPRALAAQPALTASGKPLVVYVGAEYCPYCAAQRWPLVVALSRFGHFTGVGTTASAADDVYPNTATLSFHGAGYASDYLSFQGVETQSNVKQGGQYAALDQLTGQQEQLLRTYNAPPYVPAGTAGSIPFIDVGNRFVSSGASLSPQLLAGKSAEQIARALSTPDDPIAKAVLGSANALTTALCQLTGDQPAGVCTSPSATAYQGAVHAG